MDFKEACARCFGCCCEHKFLSRKYLLEHIHLGRCLGFNVWVSAIDYVITHTPLIIFEYAIAKIRDSSVIYV